LPGFFDVIDKESLNAITLESSLTSMNNPKYEMNYNELVSRMREARVRMERLL
jgi:hypothetical protein